MIVVFAGEHREYPKQLVRRWADRGAALMVPSDLSSAGWRCISSRPQESEFVIGGVRHRSDEITGFLVCRPGVAAEDVPYIAAGERNYVAAEMNAFLVYWLTALRCPVLNRPTPRSLCGPGWLPEHWVYYAAKAGMRTQAFETCVQLSDAGGSSAPGRAEGGEGPFVDVTLVDGACFGDAGPHLAEKARALAAAAGVALVKFRFQGSDDDPCFLYADVCPRVDDAGVEEAVLAYLQTPARDRT